MSGEIFISYRREDASYPAGRLYDRLAAHFSQKIFMDVDNLDPGVDFVEAIETSVGSCEVLVAVIGKRWLASADEKGKRRLDNPTDFVRLEIATALKRGIRVIPVMVEGASVPDADQLPDDVKALVRRNALEISHSRFNADVARLVTAIERVLEKAEAEREQREKERLEAEQREKERLAAEQQARERLEAEKERLEAEQRQREEAEARQRAEKERLQAEQRDKERLEAERLEKERLAVEQQKKERLEAQQRDKERLEAQQRQRDEKERLEAERREKERLEAEEAEKERLKAELREKERLEAEQREKERLEAEQRTGLEAEARRPILLRRDKRLHKSILVAKRKLFELSRAKARETKGH